MKLSKLLFLLICNLTSIANSLNADYQYAHQTAILSSIEYFLMVEKNIFTECYEKENNKAYKPVDVKKINEYNYDYDPQFIIDLIKKSDGECEGLSFFWLYTKRISDEPQRVIDGIPVERDDNDFFHRTLSVLLQKEPRKMMPKEKEDINRFIQHMLFFQSRPLSLEENGKFIQNPARSITQPIQKGYTHQPFLDIVSVFEDTQGGQLKKVFDTSNFEMMCNDRILKDRLEKMVRPGLLVTFGLYSPYKLGAGHGIGIYQNKAADQIWVYDPNSSCAPKCFRDIEQVFDRIKNISNEFKSKNYSLMNMFQSFHSIMAQGYLCEKDVDSFSINGFPDFGLSTDECKELEHEYTKIIAVESSKYGYVPNNDFEKILTIRSPKFNS